MGKTQYYNEVTIMKAIAALFITWFHFKWTVPDMLQPIFVGGAIGNSLFFFCSGYLLKFKEEKYPGQWLVQKYLRVMVPVWIVYMLMMGADMMRGHRTLIPLQLWFYPTLFWFVNVILCYFLIVYLAKFFIDTNKGEKDKKKINVLILSLLAFAGNLLWYIFMVEDKDIIIIDEGGIKCWFYFFIFFLWGYYVRNFGERIKASRWAWMEAVLCLALFYGYKKLATGRMIEWQVVFVPLLLSYVIVAYRKLAKVLIKIAFPVPIKNIIIILASITLEIYIVQMYLINWIMPLLPFPVNMLASTVAIFAAAYVVHLLGTWLTAKLHFLR